MTGRRRISSLYLVGLRLWRAFWVFLRSALASGGGRKAYVDFLFLSALADTQSTTPGYITLLYLENIADAPFHNRHSPLLPSGQPSQSRSSPSAPSSPPSPPSSLSPCTAPSSSARRATTKPASTPGPNLPARVRRRRAISCRTLCAVRRMSGWRLVMRRRW